jgi:hypothetical protein
MANIKVTPDDLHALNLKADLAYETLKLGVERGEPALISSAEALYGHDLGGFLSYMARTATVGIPSLRKGGKRATPIEKFILQCLLMHKVPSEYDEGNYEIIIVPDPDDGMGGMEAYLDAEDRPGSRRNEVFKLIQNAAEELRREEKFDLILNAEKYVRNKYPSF